MNLTNATTVGEFDITPATNPHPAVTSNAFSIQNNTNVFPCTTCRDEYPFAAQAGKDGAIVAASASRAGDQGWVQFAYQADPTGARLCVWNIDATVASATAYPGIDGVQDAGYNSTCIALPTLWPLTGKDTIILPSEITGWVTCPAAGSNQGCFLSLIALMPWSGGWLNIVAYDTMGLASQWANVSGGLIGEGGGSTAFFTTNAQVANVLRGYSCVEPYTPPLGVLTPITCPVNPVAPQLSGEADNYYPTAESNNLKSGPATLTCPPFSFSCSISFTATAP